MPSVDTGKNTVLMNYIADAALNFGAEIFCSMVVDYLEKAPDSGGEGGRWTVHARFVGASNGATVVPWHGIWHHGWLSRFYKARLRSSVR